MTYLGLVIYRWGWKFQDNLLREWLGPLVGKMNREGIVQRFWFTRFDARGPHLSIILTLAAASFDQAAERIVPSLEQYLALHPSTEPLTADQVAALHRACRGKMKCEADRLPGLADNNTFLLYEHPASDFPFTLSAGIFADEEFWELIGDLASWSLTELAELRPAPVRKAVHWIAATDLALRRLGIDTAEVWRFHASTLLMPLGRRLADEEECVMAELPGWIGERNRERFALLFDEVTSAKEVWPHLPRLVEIASTRDPSLRGGRWALLREIHHFTLLQLALPVAQHIPLILFAWERSYGRQFGRGAFDVLLSQERIES